MILDALGLRISPSTIITTARPHASPQITGKKHPPGKKRRYDDLVCFLVQLRKRKRKFSSTNCIENLCDLPMHALTNAQKQMSVWNFV